MYVNMFSFSVTFVHLILMDVESNGLVLQEVHRLASSIIHKAANLSDSLQLEVENKAGVFSFVFVKMQVKFSTITVT